MNFGHSVEYSFWGNVEYPTNEDAKQARDAYARELIKQGLKPHRHTLPGQLRKYSGLGCPDGTIGNVYKISISKE